MSLVPYKVYVVVAPSFGERLTTLAEGIPVWIVDTPTNSAVAYRLRKERTHNHLTGITTFQTGLSSSPEVNLVAQVDSIDLHHGPFSVDPPYSQLEVFGARLSDEIRTELSRYGFNEFEVREDGFCCSRSASTYQVY